ncbi:hypothetical protein ABZ935_22095 [Streptomyces coeruleorubidus]|uniref:hypothetical protein n=1 Tax=Streptomyces coeruleorubidus TaxID=116188 RepID=UPI0033D3E407
MAGARRSARERGKSVPIDAEAVAQVAPREPNLPKACLDGPSRHIKLLVDQRGPVTQRTAIGNRLRRFLHELDPELAVASRGLRSLYILDHLAQALIQLTGARSHPCRTGRALPPSLTFGAAAVVECILVYARGPK